VEEKKASTDLLLVEMGVQRGIAEEEQANAAKEEEKSGAAAAAANVIEVSAEKELGQAKPAMEAASEAVNCLSKAMLVELKSLPKPPAGVDKVTAACLILVEHEFKNHKWDRAKKMMAAVDKFKESLVVFRGEDIPEDVVARVTPFIEDPEFTVENMKSKSAAAANLCAWVVNIYAFNRIYVKVKPLMDSLNQAREEKAAAEEQLAKVQAQVAEIMALLQQLEDTFQTATNEKAAVIAQAAACMERLGLADRLVNGLADENVRWGNEVIALREKETRLAGDVMLASAFVSYIGAFDPAFRNELWMDTWRPDIITRGIPLTEGIDPLDLLTDSASTARMESEGLPSDRISLESGSIIVNSARWPLIIDPQLQGIKWLRKREEDNSLLVLQLTQNRWLNRLEGGISNGYSVIIENLGEEIDATIDPVLSRAIYKKGRAMYLKLGGEEVEYDPKFQLYLQTKLSNPHYIPEVAAQCTLINFIATETGLEDQLLARVVNSEAPELEAKKQELVAAFQQYKIKLGELEDNLLERLANAPEDILSDIPLIEGLEDTKKAVVAINIAVEKGKETEIQINLAREVYRPMATEGAMLYFLLTQLSAIDHMYQYSLDSFVIFFYKAIHIAKASDDKVERTRELTATVRETIYKWVSRGLFERHKLILLSLITFKLIQRGKIADVEMAPEYYDFLMKCPKKVAEKPTELEWLPDSQFASITALCELEEFSRLGGDLVEAASRFREWYNHVTSETEKLPLDWAQLDREPFKKMLVVRCLRPDRMQMALSSFVANTLPDGMAYVNCDSALNALEIVDQALADSRQTIPLYFILSAGSDVVGSLDKLAVKYGMERGVSYHNISMGQGQDIVAMDRLEQAHRNGHWVILNNVHLMPRWCVELEKKLDEYALDGPHERNRLFLTSDPAKTIPIGLLNRCIKLTNEPPGGLRANLKRAICSFSKDYIDEADSKLRCILFALCFFHAVLMERKLFGPLGYNMQYPFSLGDLRDSAVCLTNYLEANADGKIPWSDLRYIFGEIMYGGHIVNDNDRLLANTYLEFHMKEELFDETEMYPYLDEPDCAALTQGISFKCPPALTYEQYIVYVDETLRTETPLAFGLHPNAEIDFRTTQSDALFATLVELQPRDAGGGDGGVTPVQVAEAALGDIQDRFGPVRYDLDDIHRSLEEQGPYQNVFLQECETMNTLLGEVGRSLKELALGFAGELTMSENMEALQDALFLDRVPGGWVKLAWPSGRAMASWLFDWQKRLEQLQAWTEAPMEIPKVTWLSGLINPQSFLTAICQVTTAAASIPPRCPFWSLSLLPVRSQTLTSPPSLSSPDTHAGHCSEEPAGARQARHTDRRDQEDGCGGHRAALARRRLHVGVLVAGRALGGECRRGGCEPTEANVRRHRHRCRHRRRCHRRYRRRRRRRHRRCCGCECECECSASQAHVSLTKPHAPHPALSAPSPSPPHTTSPRHQVLRHADRGLQGRDAGAPRSEEHLRVPVLQDCVPRTDLRVPRAAQDQVPGGPMGAGRCGANP
jgi:dynein heavy chain